MTTPCSAQILLLESSESQQTSTANLTRTEVGALNPNPSLVHGDSLHNFRLAVAFTPNVQGLEDAYIAAVEGVYDLPEAELAFSVGASEENFSDLYAEQTIFLGTSKRFILNEGRIAAIGARFRYESITTTPAYPAIHSYLFDLGVAFDISHEFSIGAMAINLFGSGFTYTNDLQESRPQYFLIGTSYRPNELPIAIHAALQQQEVFGLSLNVAAEYQPIEYVTFRLGGNSETADITAGASVNYQPLLVDLAARFDSAFGMILSFGLSAKW